MLKATSCNVSATCHVRATQITCSEPCVGEAEAQTGGKRDKDELSGKVEGDKYMKVIGERRASQSNVDSTVLH